MIYKNLQYKLYKIVIQFTDGSINLLYFYNNKYKINIESDFKTNSIWKKHIKKKSEKLTSRFIYFSNKFNYKK